MWIFPRGRELFTPDFHALFLCLQDIVSSSACFGACDSLYEAYTTRATSEPTDNTPLMHRILALREEKAHLLGYDSYAELSLVPKMAESPRAVAEFLEDLARRALQDKKEQQAKLDEFSNQHTIAKTNADRLRSQLDEMKDEFNKMKSKKDLLVARAEIGPRTSSLAS